MTDGGGDRDDGEGGHSGDDRDDRDANDTASEREDGRDPVADLATSAGDRSGDPFADLEDAVPEDAGSADEPPTDRSDTTDPGAPDPDETVREVSTPQIRTDASGGDRDKREEPLDEASDGTTDPSDRGDPFAEGSFFESMDAGEIDEATVWTELTDAQARGSVRDAGERDVAEVSKHAYCEGCEYFSTPPNVACGHDGTEILEFVDVETVRVADCPVVAERRALRRRSGDSA